MGKASSSKKIRRVQQAGVSRAPGQRRNLAYPALIVAILVVGTILVVLARDSRQATASEAPTTRDHWHEAFAVNVCGEFLDPPTDDGPDRLGIHTHGDGLIHLHPYGAGATGDNATMAVFFKQIGTVVENGTMTLKDGTTKKDGQECDGKKAEVALFVWPPQASAKTKPEKLTGDDIANYRFAENGTASVLSFNPDGFTPPLPPSMSELANPSDVEPGQSTDGLNSATSSTVAGAVTTTTAAEATTTAAPAKTTTTKPG
ncbi:MAG TPA: hypothetical protein PLS63_07705 [Microthrixaceae bacterium]|jgi:hypothetical protein|nr:hypothetical protein [Microthrixaceae bacterium]